MTKQVWRLYYTPDFFLARYLRARYNPSKDVLQDKVGNQPSNYGESSKVLFELSIKVLVGWWKMTTLIICGQINGYLFRYGLKY